MKQSISFKQQKPSTVIILGVFTLALTLFLIYEGAAKLDQILIMAIIGTVLLAYSTSYRLDDDFKIFKHFKLFGISLFKHKEFSFSPDYISVFPALFKKNAEWGPIAALGKTTENKSYIIRLFNESGHLTVFKSNSFQTISDKAKRLGIMLNVEVKIRE
ncbi:hypothetical protein KIM67_02615 [Flagellimonas sp. 389]|uniref:hypothetical protein n=1 Tax=Flagellimonas sp. 389 TaxID=2835862 RepID=UPI001BD58216|nr:hypothetical protein [Flagellimonas sp. 389]MBS9461289.1 hypothetical protein [Flagellimonas sp. 389]